jgi:hypothetical protein
MTQNIELFFCISNRATVSHLLALSVIATDRSFWIFSLFRKKLTGNKVLLVGCFTHAPFGFCSYITWMLTRDAKGHYDFEDL